MPVFAPFPNPSLSPKRKNWKPGIVAVVLVIALVMAWAWRRGVLETNHAAARDVRTAIVEQKDFVREVRIHGTVEAVESHTITAPSLSGQDLGSLVITKLVKNGAAVRRGDILVAFDRETQLRNVVDKEAEYRGLEQQIKGKQAEQAAALASDETRLQQAEDAEKAAELEMRKNEIASRIDAEKNADTLEQAKATLQQLRATFALKRQSAMAEMKILEIQRDRALTAMRFAQGNTEKMVIHADVDGVAVIESTLKSSGVGDIQEGDEVRAGLPLLQIVSLGVMQARARVNQMDRVDLREGQRVRIGLDAYPNLSFAGRVRNIAAMAQAGAYTAKVRTFVVLFSIDSQDARLLPDLSAPVDIELERQPNVLVVPRDAIFSEDGKTYALVKMGSAFEKREVLAGAANDMERVILSGLEKGSVVERNPERNSANNSRP